MMPYLLWTLGVFSVAFWPQLPGVAGCVLLAALSLVLYSLARLRCCAWLLLGMLFAAVCGQLAVQQRLPESLDKVDVTLTGEVVGLPTAYRDRSRFYFRVDEFSAPSIEADHPYFSSPRQVLLSWYFPTQTFSPGQTLTLQARLRHPRGTANPHGFDYQAWLLRNQVTATGYVREMVAVGGKPVTGISFDQWRLAIRQHIDQLGLNQQQKALLTALTIGDRQRLSADDWARYSQAGVVHLLVISGLHIGFAALLGYLLGLLLGRLVNLTGDRVYAQRWGLVVSLLSAGLYASLAGWSIPTQRAFVMVLVVVLAKLSYRHIRKGQGFAVALAAVATLDPLAVLDKGFWLSFYAVAILIWLTPNPDKQQEDVDDFPPSEQTPELLQTLIKVTHKLAGQVWYAFRVQWVVCLLLAVLLFVMQLPVPLFSPVVNMVAIPWVSLMIVPLCLLAVVCLPFLPGLSGDLWQLAGWQLQGFSELANTVVLWQQKAGSLLPAIPMPVTGFEKVAWLMVVPLFFVPVRWVIRMAGCAILLVLLYVKPARPELSVAVLDVGQGLAVVVQAAGHSLLYDSGAAFNERLNAGNAIISPYLRGRGTKYLDRVIISHDDSDHAGGLTGLMDSLTVGELILGQPLSGMSLSDAPQDAMQWRDCEHQRRWQWGDVEFSLINPTALVSGSSLKKDNNQSCILLIRYGDETILIPGDIEKPLEPTLARQIAEQLPLTLLIAPHHGSNSSSTTAFVSSVKPQHVVFSAGFNHHFGHPSEPVLQRYRRAGSVMYNTAASGAIRFDWKEGELQAVQQYRQQYQRYWN